MGNTAQTISPTSEQTEFNPQIDDIIEEAFERTGVQGTRTGATSKVNLPVDPALPV